MISAMKFWITETGIDGFRCDVAGDVPTDFWKQCIQSLKQLKPDLFMLAEAEKPELHTAGFNATYTWDAMREMEDLYKGKIVLSQFDSMMNANIKHYPKDAGRMYFTTNHDENSWNGTEFEKYGSAFKTFAVFSQTMAQSLPLIYSGQEMPNKKRLEFFVKDPIQWTGKFEMAAFYHNLLTLRKTNPALNIDASYNRLLSTCDNNIFAYIRQKEGHKVLVILNLAKTTSTCQISDKTINGQALNLFKGKKEKLSSSQTFSLEPWGYLVYDYQ
jgi:glycosidase